MTNSLISPPKNGHQKYTADQVVEAIEASKGLVSVAARRLGCDPVTVRNYVKRYASVRDALREQREGVTDMAEAALYKAINDGEAWAVCFYLKTQGKDRGYVERTETAHSGSIEVTDNRERLERRVLDLVESGGTYQVPAESDE